jgi:reactive intermediate/imine deaminase
MSRQIISTPDAPKAIGAYSQAVRCGNTVYVSGQIPLDPATGELVQSSMEAQIRRAFDNLQAIVKAANGELSQVAKVNVFLTDLSHFALLNKIMAEYFTEPYPARAAIQVAALPKGAAVEVDCVLELGE